MKIKLIFKVHAYTMLWCPDNFQVLSKQLPYCFNNLPENWSLECKDTLDGNPLVIADQEDFDVYKKAQKVFSNLEKTLHIVPAEAIQGHSRYKDKAKQYSDFPQFEDNDYFTGIWKTHGNKDNASRTIKEDFPEPKQAQSRPKEKDAQIRDDDKPYLQGQNVKVPHSKERTLEMIKEVFPQVTEDKWNFQEKKALYPDNFIPRVQNFVSEVQKSKDCDVHRREKAFPKDTEDEWVHQEEIVWHSDSHNYDEDNFFEENHGVKGRERDLEKAAKNQWVDQEDLAWHRYRVIPQSNGDFIEAKMSQKKTDNDLERIEDAFPQDTEDKWTYKEKIGWYPDSFIAPVKGNFIEPKKVQQHKDTVLKRAEKVFSKHPAGEMAQQPNIPLKVIHYYTNCNGCQMSQIVGVRYKCTVCPDFNYCEGCEQKNGHSHNFVKIKRCDEYDLFRYGLKRKRLAVKPVEWMKFDSNTDSLVQELFKVRQGSIKDNFQQEEEFKGNFVFENGLKAGKSNKIAEKYDEIPPEFLVQDDDFGDIDNKVAALLDSFPEEDIAELCEFVSKAPKDLTVEELRQNYNLKKKVSWGWMK